MTLKEIRKAAGMTQTDVGKALDVNQSAVTHWEVADTRPVRKHRVKLCKLYKISESELLAAVEESAKEHGRA